VRGSLTRRARAAAAGALGTAVLLIGPTAALATSPTYLGSIGPGGRLDSAAQVVASHGVFQYTFDVTTAGLTTPGPDMRVSLDLSNRDDCVGFELISPNGKTIYPGWTDYNYVCPWDGTGQVFDIELTAHGPAAGRWTLNVGAFDVQNVAFRIRILMEKPRHAPKQLLPDLVPWIPWEFGFTAPASSHPGTADDRDNLPGDPTVSCHPIEEAGAVDCLRFSAGITNIGDGPMYITFRGDDAYQHVYRKDGTDGFYVDNEAKGLYTETWAGTGVWHPFHQHRHLGDFVKYELFQVTDASTGTMAAVGTGAKRGFCTLSEQIADWGSNTQDHQWASYAASGDYCLDFMTLERGWSDLYRWQRPDQYVSYEPIANPDGTMPNGMYVVRLTVDPLNHIRETNESNNVGFAFIQVIDGGLGSEIVNVCEQGMGSSPFDPARTIVPDRFAWAKLASNPGYVPPTCD
jgi:hypothetical protein